MRMVFPLFLSQFSTIFSPNSPATACSQGEERCSQTHGHLDPAPLQHPGSVWSTSWSAIGNCRSPWALLPEATARACSGRAPRARGRIVAPGGGDGSALHWRARARTFPAQPRRSPGLIATQRPRSPSTHCQATRLGSSSGLAETTLQLEHFSSLKVVLTRFFLASVPVARRTTTSTASRILRTAPIFW